MPGMEISLSPVYKQKQFNYKIIKETYEETNLDPVHNRFKFIIQFVLNVQHIKVLATRVDFQKHKPVDP